MSNVTFFTTVFRASFPHLAAPWANSATDTPKYQIRMMFPKSGVCPINNQPSSIDAVWAALNQVCQETFQVPYDVATLRQLGIQYPPEFKDGDGQLQKDEQGNPVVGTVDPNTAGLWLLSAKNTDPVGTVDPTGTIDINPSAIYSGAWCRAQLEASAYTSKAGHRVVQLTLINVQMCYDDVRMDGKTTAQAATQAFGQMAVVDTNVAPGVGQAGAMPVAAAVAPAAVAPAPVAAAVAPAPVAAAVAPAPVPNYLDPAGQPIPAPV